MQTKKSTFLFEEENLDTTNPVDEFILTTLAAIAQEESRSLSENIKKNIQMRFSKGDAIFRQIYGYRIMEAIDSDGQPIKKITIDPAEADIVRLIYRRVLEGKKFTQIALELNRMLIPYPLWRDVCRGRKGDFSSPDRGWTGGRIRQILTNERYTGDVICQKTYKRDVLSKYSEKNKGQIPQYLVTDHHPAIITREDFESVQKLLSKKRSASARKIHPLSGRVVCGQCGRVYHLLPSRSIFPKWCCPQSADKKNSRLVCCEPWLYEIQIFRAIKKGFAHRFCLYPLLKNQKKNHAALDSFFSALFSLLQEQSQNSLFEDERSSLRHHVQIARQAMVRHRHHLDDVSTLLRSTKPSLAVQSSQASDCPRTIMSEHTADPASLAAWKRFIKNASVHTKKAWTRSSKLNVPRQIWNRTGKISRKIISAERLPSPGFFPFPMMPLV